MIFKQRLEGSEGRYLGTYSRQREQPVESPEAKCAWLLRHSTTGAGVELVKTRVLGNDVSEIMMKSRNDL